MTVVIALRCRDGVVMASDSQATEIVDATRFDRQKVFQLSRHAVWGATGPSGVIDDLAESFTRNASAIETAIRNNSIESQLGGLVRIVLKPHYDRYLPAPGVQSMPPLTTVLAAGLYSNGAPWILEVHHDCLVTHYESKGSHAVGSGSAMAQMADALMSHFRLQENGVDFGKLVAWRSLNAVIKTSAQGVGGPIQMWIVRKGSEASRLDDTELRTIQDAVGAWQAEEYETLVRFLAGAEQASPESPVG